MKIVQILPPFDGFIREVKSMDGSYKEKPHWRLHPIGDFNFETQKPLSNPPLALTEEDVRNLKIEQAKIWTTPYSAAEGIIKEINKEHSFLLIRRNGATKDTTTNYIVLNATQIDDDDWEHLLPNISRKELAKLQSEETYDNISEEERHRLETLGVKEHEQ